MAVAHLSSPAAVSLGNLTEMDQRHKEGAPTDLSFFLSDNGGAGGAGMRTWQGTTARLASAVVVGGWGTAPTLRLLQLRKGGGSN